MVKCCSWQACSDAPGQSVSEVYNSFLPLRWPMRSLYFLFTQENLLEKTSIWGFIMLIFKEDIKKKKKLALQMYYYY